MGYRDDILLLTDCCTFLLPKIDEGEAKALEILEHSGSTVAVNSLRSFNQQRSIIAVGMFSIFEALLQSEYNWENPITRLKIVLKGNGKQQLWAQFNTYRLAINVLKHGEGTSLNLLLNCREQLEFQIKKPDEWFYEEGDLAESHLLIKVDNDFIFNCAKVIETVNKELENIVDR